METSYTTRLYPPRTATISHKNQESTFASGPTRQLGLKTNLVS